MNTFQTQVGSRQTGLSTVADELEPEQQQALRRVVQTIKKQAGVRQRFNWEYAARPFIFAAVALSVGALIGYFGFQQSTRNDR